MVTQDTHKNPATPSGAVKKTMDNGIFLIQDILFFMGLSMMKSRAFEQLIGPAIVVSKWGGSQQRFPCTPIGGYMHLFNMVFHVFAGVTAAGAAQGKAGRPCPRMRRRAPLRMIRLPR